VAAVDDTPQVDLKGAMPVGQWSLANHVASGADAGVVDDKACRTTEPFFSGVGEVHDLLNVGDIALCSEGLSTKLGDLLDCCVRAMCVDIGAYHSATPAGEFQRERTANTRAGAGDDGVGEVGPAVRAAEGSSVHMLSCLLWTDEMLAGGQERLASGANANPMAVQSNSLNGLGLANRRAVACAVQIRAIGGRCAVLDRLLEHY
jgi:hypothetical protein